jgi:DNA-binding winged helix-turn-helix (wHTH) protein
MIEPDAAAGAGRMLQLPARYIRFGPFQIDQQRREVSKSGSRLKLQGKVYEVLIALIEKQGNVVTREELRVRLWPAESHVNYDANVNTTVNKLRQALGDSSDKPLYIETVPRRGYCLIVQPEFADAPLPSALVPAIGQNGHARAAEKSSPAGYLSDRNRPTASARMTDPSRVHPRGSCSVPGGTASTHTNRRSSRCNFRKRRAAGARHIRRAAPSDEAVNGRRRAT